LGVINLVEIDNMCLMIQLHRLEGFYRVAKAGGYARAVRDFPYPITEPAVHQQVRKLEQELGQRLLRRTAKDRMATTAAGRHLFDFCAPFFERVADVALAVSTGRFGGTLRIDAGPQEIRHVIPEWLRRLRRAHPDVRVELTEVLGIDANRLRTGEADLIVEHWPTPPPDVAQRRVGVAYGTWVVPAHLAPSGKVDPKALSDSPFVSFRPGTSEALLQLAGLELFGLNPARLLSASTVDAILGFVQAGLGYSLVPWPSREGPRASGIVAAPVRARGAAFPITASWLKKGGENSLVTAALGAASGA
jgi:DNA-binding transcriptional LysR family regulator